TISWSQGQFGPSGRPCIQQLGPRRKFSTLGCMLSRSMGRRATEILYLTTMLQPQTTTYLHSTAACQGAISHIVSRCGMNKADNMNNRALKLPAPPPPPN